MRVSVLGLCTLSASAHSDVIASAPDHYTLKQSAFVEKSPGQVWQRLVDPASWWHPDHTYSGSSQNLSLGLHLGGLWREDWDGGTVTHGEVIYVKYGEVLRLDAPFGPLQDRAVTVVWSITLTPEGSGTRITFDEIANGTAQSGLDELAPAVDFVKTEAINRLADF